MGIEAGVIVCGSVGWECVFRSCIFVRKDVSLLEVRNSDVVPALSVPKVLNISSTPPLNDLLQGPPAAGVVLCLVTCCT